LRPIFMMKPIPVVLLFASPLFNQPAFGQDDAAAARTAAGCGSDQVHFDVKTDKKHHPAPQPETGKALIYVFQEVRQGELWIFATITTKVGLDGAWVGANHGDSYFFFAANPGNHRVCAAWQSTSEVYSKLASAADLTIEPGKVYYLRVKVYDREYKPQLKMEHVDPAEAQLLIAASSFNASHPRK